MKPDACISQAHFVSVLKTQLRAAAAAAVGMPDEQPQSPQAHRGSFTAQALRTIMSQTEGSRSANAGAAAAEAPARNPLGRRSVFEDYSNEALDVSFVQTVDPACAEQLKKCDEVLAKCEAAAAAAEAAAACDAAAAAAAAELDPFMRAAREDLSSTLLTAQSGGAAAAGGGGEVLPAGAATATPVQLSRQCSSAFSYGEGPVFAPGVLTCPRARLKQHTMRRQLSRRAGSVQPPPELSPNTPECQQQARQQQPHMQVRGGEWLLKCLEAGAWGCVLAAAR